MILAGDIGGTHARLAFFQSQNGNLTPVAEGVFPSRDHSGLDEIVGQFVAKQSLRPDVACFGVAGPVRNGKVETSNLPWTVEASRLAGELHLPSALLINDLEANAWGIASLGDQDQIALNRVKGMPVGNQAVISAGTGLGEAGLFWNGNGYEIFASEGGHCDFAPRTELEIELLRYLVARFGHVSFERIVSGPGLVNVYNFLRDTHRGEEPQWLTDELAQGDQAATISRAAVAGKSVLAEHALDLWISIYGAEAGNLALKLMATGGVFLGGGIAPKIVSKLSGLLFMQAFVSKGRLQPLLESIPVKVITNDKIALFGAARYAVAKGTPPR
ncbi:MAG: glucokinase [Acidobacteria bacterium]|nr:MAG: glucokinase [Acidobacteriota bacterium]